jgi:hypothetical protein
LHCVGMQVCEAMCVIPLIAVNLVMRMCPSCVRACLCVRAHTHTCLAMFVSVPVGCSALALGQLCMAERERERDGWGVGRESTSNRTILARTEPKNFGGLTPSRGCLLCTAAHSFRQSTLRQEFTGQMTVGSRAFQHKAHTTLFLKRKALHAQGHAEPSATTFVPQCVTQTAGL